MTTKKTKKEFVKEDNSNLLIEERVKKGNIILPMFESLQLVEIMQKYRND